MHMKKTGFLIALVLLIMGTGVAMAACNPCCCQEGSQKRCFTSGICCLQGTTGEFWDSSSCYRFKMWAEGPSVFTIGQKTPITLYLQNNGAYSDTYSISYVLDPPTSAVSVEMPVSQLVVSATDTDFIKPRVLVMTTNYAGKIVFTGVSASDPSKIGTAEIKISEGLRYNLPEFSGVLFLPVLMLVGSLVFYKKYSI